MITAMSTPIIPMIIRGPNGGMITTGAIGTLGERSAAAKGGN
jgi:hypothetical protein